MKGDIFKKVRHRKSKEIIVRILTILDMYEDSDVQLSIKKIYELSGVKSMQSVYKYLNLLEEEGYVLVEKGKGPGSPNKYKLTEKGRELAKKLSRDLKYDSVTQIAVRVLDTSFLRKSKSARYKLGHPIAQDDLGKIVWEAITTYFAEDYVDSLIRVVFSEFDGHAYIIGRIPINLSKKLKDLKNRDIVRSFDILESLIYQTLYNLIDLPLDIVDEAKHRIIKKSLMIAVYDKELRNFRKPLKDEVRIALTKYYNYLKPFVKNDQIPPDAAWLFM